MALPIAILASGSGTNAQAIFDKIFLGQLDAVVNLVISNRPEAQVLTRAHKLNIPTLALDHTKYQKREDFDKVLVQALQDANVELIVLAGYMRLLTSCFFEVFSGKIINMHPALLPSFKGEHGALDACLYGVKISGCTAHFVVEEVDDGPIIAQGALPLLENENPQELQKRIQSMEHRLFPQVIQWIAEKRIIYEGRKVTILPSLKTKSKIGMDIESPYFIWPPLEEGF